MYAYSTSRRLHNARSQWDDISYVIKKLTSKQYIFVLHHLAQIFRNAFCWELSISSVSNAQKVSSEQTLANGSQPYLSFKNPSSAYSITHAYSRYQRCENFNCRSNTNLYTNMQNKTNN